MTPDMKRLCEAAEHAYDNYDIYSGNTLGSYEAGLIVRAVLTELREVSGETEGYRKGLWSRRNVEALVRDILAEPATA